MTIQQKTSSFALFPTSLVSDFLFVTTTDFHRQRKKVLKKP